MYARALLPLVATALVAAASTVSTASAQSLVRGTILDDETASPISGARLQVVSESGAYVQALVSDSAGAFAFAPKKAGRYRVDARRIGYVSTVTPALNVGARDTMDVEIRLRTDAVLIAPIEVTAWIRPSPVLEGFHHRMKLGLGYHLTREDIEKRGSLAVSDIIMTSPGIRMRTGRNPGSKTFYTDRSLTGDDCQAQIYVDGSLVNRRHLTLIATADSTNRTTFVHDDAFNIDDFVSPGAVEGIEIYRGTSQIPAEFYSPDARCGVIAIWTRRGLR